MVYDQNFGLESGALLPSFGLGVYRYDHGGDLMVQDESHR